jgi:hypothetical protein
MTSEQIDQTVEPVETHDPEAPAAAGPELGTAGTEASASATATAHATAPDGQTRRALIMRPVAAVAKPVAAVAKPVSSVASIARTSVVAAGRGATRVVARLPRTIRATQAGATEATNALQTLPDPTLRSLAATSVGIGAGLYLARAPRAVVVVGVVPAMIMGAAIALRPTEPAIPEAADR